jgi:putative peptidoglycan binding protein
MGVRVPFPRVRKVGCKGRDVQQDRRAMTRAGFWPVNKKTKPPSFYDAAIYTHKFAMAVRAFQRKRGLKVTGEIDRATHNELAKPWRSRNGSVHYWGWYGKDGARIMGLVQKKLIAQEKYLLSSGSVVQRGVAAALMCVRHRSVIHYTQGGLRMVGVNRRMYPPNYPHYGDCSSMVTWWYFVSGAPDPNGLGYNGLGFTGTQSPRGVRVHYSSAPPMAVVFYGRGNTIGHEALVVKTGSQIVSHGSEIGPVLVGITYRSPIQANKYDLRQRPGFQPWPVARARG